MIKKLAPPPCTRSLRCGWLGVLALIAAICCSPLWAEAPLKVAGNYPGYVSFGPSLIVNLASDGAPKFLRVEIELYVLTPRDGDVVNEFLPVIRDRLVSLYGGREMEALQSAEGREALRTETLEELRDTLMKFAERPAIEDLYFTGFIMQ